MNVLRGIAGPPVRRRHWLVEHAWPLMIREAISSLTHPLRFCLCLALVLGAPLFGARAALAQDVPSLQGTFVLDASASEDVARAIDAALAGMGGLHRRFARGHLQRANQPYRTVTIEQDAETISIATEGSNPVRAPIGGAPIEWRGADGKRMRVTVTREDGAIRQTLVGEDHERENVFRPSADGRDLILSVTMRSERLPDPIRYELVYRREPVDEQGPS
jgi:hypothetical protein